MMNCVKRVLYCDLKEIEKDIEERDHRDMTREIAPLKTGGRCNPCGQL